MSININMVNADKFIQSSTMKQFIMNFKNNSSLTMTHKYTISNDILFLKTKSLINKEIVLQSKQKVSSLSIRVLLNGNIAYKDNFLNCNNILKQNNINIQYINEFNITSTLKNNFHNIGLHISNNFLEENFPRLLEIHSKDFASLPSVTLKNQLSKNIHLANELYNSPFEGELQNIYLQSKVLELIYNEFSEMLNFKEQENKKVKLNQDDIEALHKVRNLILLENDFSDLMSLSKKVRLNEFKLKYGFKQLFNTTIGQMILEQKMLYAKQLLETSEFSISEISSFVGYKHQQNFSTAFIQFFGIRPKDLMKSRNYYY
ncbi:helix-turn-helix domain-containing protein [Aliarcobacter butzleri]|uniref:AraC family transcriptional regulator n=1 Tax=Aliarcobacter butzleri TaxID=28197 RepID=A0AAW6VII8_9BACT|nr:AraC family transcriptional regulator [Aliarcobacter butzleri]MDK2041698.1 AraC family transcriptional regulator [Aliarcobacter butzleri]MDK2096924.1 AraC family transcriptional regulator [Aliarcobacter butzleri]